MQYNAVQYCLAANAWAYVLQALLHINNIYWSCKEPHELQTLHALDDMQRLQVTFCNFQIHGHHSQHEAVKPAWAHYVTYVLQMPEHVVAHGMDAALLLRLFASQQQLAPAGQLSHGCGVLVICEALSVGVNAIAAQLLCHLLLQLLLYSHTSTTLKSMQWVSEWVSEWVSKRLSESE